MSEGGEPKFSTCNNFCYWNIKKICPIKITMDSSNGLYNNKQHIPMIINITMQYRDDQSDI